MTNDDAPGGDDPTPGGDSFDPSNKQDTAPPGGNSSPPGGQAPPPNGGQAPPPSGGQAPPPSGGGPPGRQLNLKRIVAVLAVVGLVIGGGAFFALGGMPDVPAIGGCNADTPTASFATHQSSGDDGERVALQLTNFENGEYVVVKNGETEVANMTGVGNTTTVTGLSTGDSLTYVGANECGQHEIGTYTVG